MLRQLFTAMIAGALVALAMTSANAGTKRYDDTCVGNACQVLHKGHVRGRIPQACVQIPYVKKHYGYVAMFVLRDFKFPPAGMKRSAAIVMLQEQLEGSNVIFQDSKVTGKLDDFCRGRQRFAGGTAVIICDESSFGFVRGAALRYALEHGHTEGHRRVEVGVFLRESAQN